MSNDSDQQSAPYSRKWSLVIADPTAFAKKIDDIKKTAISEDLNGRRILEQDDGVSVAVYDLSPETHVGIVIGSCVSQASASQVIGSVCSISLLPLRNNAVTSSRPCGAKKFRPSFLLELALTRF
jgi:hypothetical protein